MLSLLTVFYLPLLAQLKFDGGIRFTAEDGLPSDDIRTVAQSPDGFLWIGTSKGISRFDGIHFKNYAQNLADATALFDNRIQHILADSHSLYIATHLGFSILDFKTERFSNFQFDQNGVRVSLDRTIAEFGVNQLHQARDGTIWIGMKRKGFIQFDPTTRLAKPYHYSAEKVSLHFPKASYINHGLSIQQDRFQDSIFWAGTAAGLLKINSHTGHIQWHLYPKKDEKRFVAQNAIRRIYQHDDGLLYIGSWNAKVSIFDPDAKAFYSIPIKNSSKEEQEAANKLLDIPIRFIRRKSAEEIWITSFLGIMEYHTKSQQWENISWSRLENNFFKGIDIVDNQHRAWLPVNAAGLVLFDPLYQQFIKHDYTEYNKQGLGFAYYFVQSSPYGDFAILPRWADGILHRDVKKQQWKKSNFPKKYLDERGFTSIEGYSISPSGEWSLSLVYRLVNYHPDKDTFKEIPLPKMLQDKQIQDIFWDSKDRLWVATKFSGCFRWTPLLDKWEELNQFFFKDSSTNSISIGNFFEDSQHNLWMNGDWGFGFYNLATDSFTLVVPFHEMDYTIQTIKKFFEDKQGRIWIHSGLALGYLPAREPEKGIQKMYSLPADFQIERIYFLEIDSQGQFWGLIDEGLYQINPDKGTAKKYNLKYGVEESDFYGFEITQNDQLFIGGQNKMWVGNIVDLTDNSILPKPYLTDILVLQKPLESDTAIFYLSKLDLSHFENFFSFNFSAITNTYDNQTLFSYQLEGFDQNWSDPSTQTNANYTNVPSGDYVFRLKAATDEGIWNEKAFELPIHIATPWWHTNWFYFLSAISILGIIYSFYQYRVRQIQKDAQLKADFEKQLLEVEMNGLRAQMNPHFLFNSLNSIETYILMNDTKKAAKYLSDFARLIRLILQNSRANYITLTDELKTLELYIQMESLRFTYQFKYQIQIEESVQTDGINIPPMLVQPYVENAIWHGLMHKEDAENALLSIHLTEEDGYLTIIIEDNGIGRKAAAQFKSKRAKDSRKSVGMKITSDRIQMINQVYDANTSVEIIDLKTEDGVGCGTRVVLKIPV